MAKQAISFKLTPEQLAALRAAIEAYPQLSMTAITEYGIRVTLAGLADGTIRPAQVAGFER